MLNYVGLQHHLLWIIFYSIINQSQQSLLTLSASSTSQILTPVAGLRVGNVLPLVDVSHSLLIKICRRKKVQSVCYVSWKTQRRCTAATQAALYSYHGVSDILDLDRFGKSQSWWGVFSHSILCCSVLCHSRSAVQSRASLSAPSTQRCQPIHWLFIRMWSSTLLTQQLRRTQLRPCNSQRLLSKGILVLAAPWKHPAARTVFITVRMCVL